MIKAIISHFSENEVKPISSKYLDSGLLMRLLKSTEKLAHVKYENTTSIVIENIIIRSLIEINRK